jgi:hypothetical protein
MITVVLAIVVFTPLFTSDQWSITSGILLVMNPAETLSLFWYVMLVMFDGRIQFVRYMYSLFWTIAGIFFCQYFAQTSLFLRLMEKH